MKGRKFIICDEKYRKDLLDHLSEVLSGQTKPSQQDLFLLAIAERDSKCTVSKKLLAELNPQEYESRKRALDELIRKGGNGMGDFAQLLHFVTTWQTKAVLV